MPPKQVSATDHPDLPRLPADAAAIVAEASGDNLAAARAGFLVWVGAEEAAAYLNYPLGTFKAPAGRGEIPRHKRGAGYRYEREELDQRLLLG
jgi:excisionase family DNA binding protein